MDQATHNKIVSFICGIADDMLRECVAWLDGAAELGDGLEEAA